MSRTRWSKETIDAKCEELGIMFLDIEYDYKVKQNFTCSCGGHFERIFANVLLGQTKCIECSKRDLAIKNRKRALNNFEELLSFIEESGIDIVVLASFDEYENNKTPLKTQCACGNIYYPTANSLKRGLNTRCKVCGDASSGKKRRKAESEIREFIENSGYQMISYRFTDSAHWMEVSCEKEQHDSYMVDWGNFYIGNRCPQCNLSKGEERVAKYLTSKGISFDREFKFSDLVGMNGGKLRFDFRVVFEDNVYLIEYDGEQHFKPKFGEYEFERTVFNDNMKNKYCEEKGLNLLRIPYVDFDNIEFIISKHFKIN